MKITKLSKNKYEFLETVFREQKKKASNLSGYYNPDSKNGHAHYKKKKVYTNLTYKHKCKNPNRNPQCIKTYCNITKNISPRLKG